MFIHSASHDAGTAIGACYYVDRIIKRNNRPGFIKPAMYLGSGYTNGQIKAVLDEESLKYQYLTDEELISNCAYDLSNNLVAGWFQGKMEWGPRALGNRSILANPAHRSTVDRINHTIKFREPFRPFAPSVLKEEAKNYFRFPEGADMSYMLYLADAYEVTIKKAPAIVHVDGTSRIQTVDFADNPLYWKLINKFKSITGIPILLNTSFNVKGEPIVRTPR